MKAAEPREGKRSLSMCDDEESAAKRNKKQVPKITGDKDVFCWTCHRPGNVAMCSECPRAYHLKCGHLDRIPEPSEKWVCPECDTIQRADKLAPSSPAHKSTFSRLLGFVLDRVKRIDGVDNFSAPVDTNKWHDYLDYVIQPMDLPKLRSNIDAHKYRSVEGFLADFRWLVHASYVYNSVHSVYTKIAKSMMNVAKQECEEVKNCSECYMHACTLGDAWFIEPCTSPHVLVWAQLSGFPYWPAKIMRLLSGDVVDVRFFGDHTRANVPASSCFLYSRVMPCSVKSKKHSSKITNGIEEAEVYVKNLKSTYNTFCYAQYRVNYLPKEDECMRKLQLPEFPIPNATPEFLAKVETLRKEKMLEDKEFHSEMKRMISEQEKSKRPSLPQKRKSVDSGSKLLEMKRKLVKIDTPQGQKLAIMNMSGSESDTSPKHVPSRLKSPVVPVAKVAVSAGTVRPETNGDHNSNKTPPKVDDETIKQVLARSPKELTPMSDRSSPITPPKDSGIIESLSRKLFTPPKKLLVNGSERRLQLTRSLSQRLISKREGSLESDSDSDALVIAEESSPNEISDKNQSPEVSEPKSQHSVISSPPEAVKLYLKTRSSEMKRQQILIRKSYIASENSSQASRVTARDVGNEDPLIAEEDILDKPVPLKQIDLHKAAPLSGTELPGKSPLVSRRTRTSINIDGISGVMKKDIGLSETPFSSSSENSPTEQEKPEAILKTKKPKKPSKEACDPQIDELAKAESEHVLSKISSPSTDSYTEGSKDTLADETPRRATRGSCKPHADGPTVTDIETVESTSNSLTTTDNSSSLKEAHTGSSYKTGSEKLEGESKEANEPQPGSSHTEIAHAQPTIRLLSTEDVSPLAKEKEPAIIVAASRTPIRPPSEEYENAVDELAETECEPDQSVTSTPTSGDSSSSESDERPKITLASKIPRESPEESDELPTDAPPETSCEPVQSATSPPSAEGVSSPTIELKDNESRIPLMEICDPDNGNPCKTDSESLPSESMGIVTGSTLSAETVPSEPALDLPPTKLLPDDSKVTSDETIKEPLGKLIPHDDGEDVGKDHITLDSLPANANSNEDPAPPSLRDVQQTTPVKSVICHSTDVSPVHVSSPESSSLKSSPEGGVLVMNAVRNVPASMKVPVIKVARSQYAPHSKEIGQSCDESKFKNEESSDILPSEETDKVDGSVTCTASEPKVSLLNTSETRIHCALPIAANEENVKQSAVEALQKSIDHITQEKTAMTSEDRLPEKMAEGSQEKPKTISSLDMLDGDLSHLYEDLEPTEEDDESDEPVSSEVTPEGTPRKEDALPVSIGSEADGSQKEGSVSDTGAPQGSPQLQASEDVEPAAMDLDDPAQKETEPDQKRVADSETPSPQNDHPSAENALAAQSVVKSPIGTAGATEVKTPTGTAEESQAILEPHVGGETVVADERPSETNSLDQPATDSCETDAISSTSEMSVNPLESKLTLQPPEQPYSSSGDADENATELMPSHTPEKSDGKCTCIMCHVAHPGASFDKSVEDHIMRSIELVEPKRGLSRETEEFLKRLNETDAFTVSQEGKSVVEASIEFYSDARDASSSKRRRKSVNLVQRPISLASLAPRKSTDSLESGPSTSSSKQSRPLPGLVTLTKEVVQRRLSSEQKNSQSENSGGLQISSSMSLNPSHLGQMSSKSPTEQSNADAKKAPAGKDITASSSSESQCGNDPKKASQNATTMPLPIVIKPDPDAVPEVPNNQAPPAPPKPTIKLKQMSALLERPPPPPSPKKPEHSNSNRKECSTPKFNMVPPFEPKKTLADVRRLIESKSQFISAKLKKDIYTLFDQIQHDYDSHMELLEHIADASLNTVESTLETNKNLVFEEMKIRLRNQVDAHVADVKKKQWCILCGNEAAFHCCWGYNYCCEDCQKNDWAEHTKVCTQYNMAATDPYIRASPRFQALLEKQMSSGGKKIMVQDLIDSPVAVSVQSSPPGKAKPSPAKGRKILAGPRTSFLEGDLSLDASNITSLSIPAALAKTSAVTTTAIQRMSDQVTSYKIVQPGRTVRIINPPKQRLPQMVSKPQIGPKAVARPVVSSPSSDDLSQSGKIAARLTTLGQWGSVKLPSSIEVSRTPVTSGSGVQRKVVTSGRIVPGQQTPNRTSFLRVMDDVEIASILQRNHLSEY